MQFSVTQQSDTDDVQDISLGSLDDLIDFLNDKVWPVRIFKDNEGLFDTEYVMVVEDGE